MHNHLIVLVTASIVALAAPSLFERYEAKMSSGRPEALDRGPDVVEAAAPAPGMPRETRIAADWGGHFTTDAMMNGRSIPVIFDTGASRLSLDEATARRLGVTPAAGDFRHPVQTANGVTMAAWARIDLVSIGTVSVQDVDAMVVRGAALPKALLGMSFLTRLKGYSVEDGRLTLRN
ncbi:retropepsin-like aspartic protease family protein [Jiella avicenniae]|uniref:TIGR02281 family clan AA aspartic protease n=1 Tax=Jiella avicenniae TaxID=2907202 RepID=A0A9X1T5E8_9HYPH|nr:TIGR02281 family clan AA aspartic protease [Jiella avicenniae]MCE7028809.1 TIGR02281 family clan AA aspartic protease [Jiella avicenniae]